MATLTRTGGLSELVDQPSNLADVPAPFPINELQQIRATEQPHDGTTSEVNNNTALIDLETENDVPLETSRAVLHEILPSIAYVQRSCLMALSNLLSIPETWNPIVSGRRHSLPSDSEGTDSLRDGLDSSSALQALVTNLRNRDPPQEMIEYSRSTTDAELIHELRTHVEWISPSLAQADDTLARALVSLLAHFNRLSIISAAASRRDQQSPTSHSQNVEPLSSSELLSDLTRQLNNLRFEGLLSQPSILGPSAPPVLVVEAALLWSRIDDELETVLSLCRERAEDLFRSPPDIALPPQYDLELYSNEAPPDYEEHRMSLEDVKSRDSTSLISPRPVDEKMRIDLENVTMAIDRLYQVTPQLHNQRVELKSSKLAQMERARQEGSSTSRSSRDDKADVRELENIFDLLGKASERSLNDQSFVLEGGMQKRLEKVKQREQQEREAFVVGLVRHSSSGRLRSQDAVYHPRTRDPHALLTLPEFIREPAPAEPLEKEMSALSEPAQDRMSPPSEINEPKAKKNSRNRSMSAPHIPWLRSGSRSPASSSHTSKSKSKASNAEPLAEIDIAYVAENHENLRHIIVFLQVAGATSGIEVELEVPSSPGSTESGESFIVKSGNCISGPLPLPGRVLPGKKSARLQNSYFEIKLPTLLSSEPPFPDDDAPLLNASQLMSCRPSIFACASCSLPVIQSSGIADYRDLPSEHWQELIDAWMCHPDQKLHEHVVKHGKMGFWPQPHQALVGGSYILFEDACISKSNLYVAEAAKRGETWCLVRCLCGAVLGRCQGNQQGNIHGPPTTYRILKYAIRPISSTTEPPRIPLSAFVVGDMNEFVQAHATYRFVVLDEEDERPRMLLWMFKPSIRLAYNMRTPRASPKNAAIHAAKVLYKLFGPSEDPIDLNSVLNKYPGFPQAEYLYYPMNVCRQIAGLLKESNRAYPESLRSMTGLEVGWLRRAECLFTLSS